MNDLRLIEDDVHTLSLYVGPERSRTMAEDMVALAPGRVIFNPGTESSDLERTFDDAGIAHDRACTLVLLNTDQF